LYGSDKRNLEKIHIDLLGCAMFASRTIQFILICYVLGTVLSHNADVNAEVPSKLENAGLGLLFFVALHTVLYILKFIWCLVKGIFRCFCGDHCCRS
jgi:hypothetical protein